MSGLTAQDRLDTIAGAVAGWEQVLTDFEPLKNTSPKVEGAYETLETVLLVLQFLLDENEALIEVSDL